MNGKTIALWIVSVLLAVMFMMSGGMKLINPAQASGMFVNYGYPAWFALIIGAVGVLGGVLLLIPRVAFYEAGALAVVMAGATFTHLKTAGEAPRAIVPLVLLVLSIVVALARRPQA